ncbi:hypothetical protein K470DRAFT_290390 [Piedraia hortae CBS 480.64]|uniref:Uncharacterized protein n=1 Tax=Piedraia hortae CBS 480.64 TaxID=1314780 RepID=A0A6A7C6M0_9PEZI|nr:hypothetical protein K470DRAFT_290390 [Piedraia hortae CBS 480.64]
MTMRTSLSRADMSLVADCTLHKRCSKQPYRCTTCAMQALMTVYWSNKNPESACKALYVLRGAITFECPDSESLQDDFFIEIQSDSHELAVSLVNRLREQEIVTGKINMYAIFDYTFFAT